MARSDAGRALAVLAVIGACTQPTEREEQPSASSAAVTSAPNMCEGYKPHIDGDVGANAFVCTTCGDNNRLGVQHGRLATNAERSSSCAAHEAPNVVDASTSVRTPA